MSVLQERFHSTVDKYQAKDFGFFFKKLNALSDKQIQEHYHLYEGYVKKSNEIQEKLKSADKASSNHNFSEYRGLQVDQSHNLNGMILHELYFSNLTDKDSQLSDALKVIINRDFGSYENFMEDFKATLKAARGWGMCAYNNRDGKLHNYAIDGHNLHMPISVRPILIIDVWEHAFAIDYATNKPDYINSICACINWNVVSQRLDAALKDVETHQM